MLFEKKYLKKFNKQVTKIHNDFVKEGTAVPKRANRILFNGANSITNTVKRSMKNTVRAKHSYSRQKGKKRHFPSKDGFPPAIDSGQLMRNTMLDMGILQAEIGYNKNAPYGKFLEKGTKNIEARPAIKPAVDKHRYGITRDLFNIVPDIAATIFERLT